MNIKEFTQSTLAILILLLTSNLVFKGIYFHGSMFTLKTLITLVSYILIYILGNVLLAKTIRDKFYKNDIIFITLMAIYIFSIFTVVTNGIRLIEIIPHYQFPNSFEARSLFEQPYSTLFSIIISIFMIMIVNKFLQSKNDDSISLENQVSTHIMFFGILFIISTTNPIAYIFTLANYIIFGYVGDLFGTIWTYLKTIIIYVAILLSYWKVSLIIEKKHASQLKQSIFYILTVFMLVIGLYSLHLAINIYSFSLIMSPEFDTPFQMRYILFIPILIGYYFLSIRSKTSQVSESK